MPSIRRDSTDSLVFSIRTVTPESNSHTFNRNTSGPVGEQMLSEAEFCYHIVTAGFDESPGQEIPFFHAPQYADQWPIGFMQPEQWRRIWNGQQFELDPFLQYGRMETGRETPWIHELVFKGVKYHLTIDHQKLEGLPTFTEGMVVKCRQWNCNTQRYIIDHCAYKDDVNAYLKMICYDEYHNAYDIRFATLLSFSLFPSATATFVNIRI